MRWLLFVVALGACSHDAAGGPRWPKQHEAEKDGGESLAPHETKAVSVAVESSSDDKPAAEKPAADKPADKPATTGGEPAASPAAGAPATDEILQTEDIVIEIDD